MKTVIGLFNHLGDATSTLGDFTRLGLGKERVGLLSSEQSAATGTGMNMLDLPEIGRAAANQPMLEWLKAPGGIAGALVNLGVSKADAARCIDTLKRGGTLEAVVVDDSKEAEAQAIMRARSARYEDTNDLVIPIIEEELEVGTRQVESGGVRVSTRISAIPVERTVTVREEHVRVERRIVDRLVDDSDESFRDRAFEMKARSEQPVVSKRAHVVEEIRVRKNASEHDEQVRDKVRHTDVDISELPGELPGTPRREP
jgi:uncharacterized protein (TIGR02271 family)